MLSGLSAKKNKKQNKKHTKKLALGGEDKCKLNPMKAGKLHQLFQFLSSLHVPKELIVPKESC